MEDIVYVSDRELRSRLRSVEDVILDIVNNITLINKARELYYSKRDEKRQSQLRSISVRIRALDSRLQYMEANEQLAERRIREVENQLQSLNGSIQDAISNINLKNNMTSFMTTINDRRDQHLPKAETTSVKPDITTASIINRSCRTVPKSGVYNLTVDLIMTPVTVYCDQDTDGGGWIVFMRRQDGSVNFTRSWSDYKLGFGSPDGEFWAGNDFLHKLTKPRSLQLRIDMMDFDGNTKFALFEEFQVGAEEDKYRLHVNGYSGTAGDSLIDTRHSFFKHAGMQFSTFDSNNDKSKRGCAEWFKAGWWYSDCLQANLNGVYSRYKHIPWAMGIVWRSWKNYDMSLKRVEMKMR